MATLQLAATVARSIPRTIAHSTTVTANLPLATGSSPSFPLLQPSSYSLALARESTDTDRRQIVQERLRAEALRRIVSLLGSVFDGRFRWDRSFWVRLLVFWPIVLLGFLSRAMWAAWVYRDQQCDQELRYYAVVGAAVAILPLLICMPLCRLAHQSEHGIPLQISGAMCLCILAWGCYMVCAFRECDRRLMTPTLHYLIFDIVSSLMLFCIAFSKIPAFRRFSLALATMRTGGDEVIGCVDAVHMLPTVETDAPELICSTHNTMMECSICMNPLNTAPHDDGFVVPVRTPCNHYYHQACLAQWCTRHVHCPVCRHEVDPGGLGTSWNSDL